MMFEQVGSVAQVNIDIEKDIYDFCNQIKSTSSTNEKKTIIAKYQGNKGVEEFLKFLFDKTIVTGISKQKMHKVLSGSVELPHEYKCKSILEIIEYLKEHNTGTDVDINVCQDYISSIYCNALFRPGFISEELALEYKDMLEKIITKSLRLGIDTKLVNNAIPGLIKVHEVQQANALKNVKLKDNEWICLSEKLNGNRATYIDGKLISRQGKEFTNLNHIIKDLNRLRSNFDVNMVFDGEIIRKNVDNLSDNENFRIGTGLLTSDAEDKTALSFVIFDLLPCSEFKNGQSKLTYKDRMSQMCQVCEWISNGAYNHIGVVDFLYEGNDHSMIETCLAEMDSQGKEGCMLARDVPYYCKRHNGLLKVKTFYTMDLEVVGFEEGKGRLEGTLGALIVKYKDNLVGVGGFTDVMKDEIWNNRDKYLGRIAEVKYKEITHDKVTRKESLQFPTFVQFREEGKQVSYD